MAMRKSVQPLEEIELELVKANGYHFIRLYSPLLGGC